MLDNYFQGTSKSPYHISVGAIVRNKEGKICTHYFDVLDHPTMPRMENFYILMRETIEPNETLEKCLHRGLMEEWGMNATCEQYVGSIVSYFEKENVRIQKTTLYFLCTFISLDESKRGGDIESKTQIRWMDKNDLILKMKEQGIRLQREDADESSVLERLSE